MNPKDILLNILIGMGFLGIAFGVFNVDLIYVWVLAVFAIILWVLYVIFAVRDHVRDIRYPVIRYRPDGNKKAYGPLPNNQKKDKNR